MTPRRRILPIFVPHAGCPNDCVFCNQKRISGSLLPASAETVRAAVSVLEPGSGYELAFYGGSFTAIPEAEQEALLAAAIPARESGAVSALRVSTRPDAVTEEKLARLRRYGVETVELGAQSMCDEVLLRSGRGHMSEDTVKAAKLVKDAGFTLILQMMTGLPGSDDARDIQTARSIAALHPDGVRIYPTVILRDTPLCDLWQAGKYREHTVEDAVRVCARILPIFECSTTKAALSWPIGTARPKRKSASRTRRKRRSGAFRSTPPPKRESASSAESLRTAASFLPGVIDVSLF